MNNSPQNYDVKNISTEHVRQTNRFSEKRYFRPMTRPEDCNIFCRKRIIAMCKCLYATINNKGSKYELTFKNSKIVGGNLLRSQLRQTMHSAVIYKMNNTYLSWLLCCLTGSAWAQVQTCLDMKKAPL